MSMTMTISLNVPTQAVHAIPAMTSAAWHEHHFRAMNSTIHLNYYGQNLQLGSYVETFFEQSEQRLSRFRPSSELARLNQSARSECHLSADLFNVLEAARWAAHATDGLFDPTILDDLERAGYDRSFEQVHRHDGPCRADGRECNATGPVTMQDVKLDRATRRVRRPAGTAAGSGRHRQGLDGGPLRRFPPPGRSVPAQCRRRSLRLRCARWRLRLGESRSKMRCSRSASIARLVVTNAAVATSTIVKRRWQRGGQSMHHIIDPRTGQTCGHRSAGGNCRGAQGDCGRSLRQECAHPGQPRGAGVSGAARCRRPVAGTRRHAPCNATDWQARLALLSPGARIHERMQSMKIQTVKPGKVHATAPRPSHRRWRSPR